MSNTLWFKRKRYGWGWTPVTTEGWLVTILYIILVVALGMRIDASSHSISDTLIGMVVPLVILTAALLGICYKKGEAPRWQWGKTREERINNREDSNVTVEQGDERKDVYEKEQNKDETPHDENRS